MTMSPMARQNRMAIARGALFADLTVHPRSAVTRVNSAIFSGSRQSTSLKLNNSESCHSPLAVSKDVCSAQDVERRRRGQKSNVNPRAADTPCAVRRILPNRRNQAHAPLPIGICQVDTRERSLEMSPLTNRIAA